MREQSLLDEMRAAVRGDRERAAERRVQETPEASETREAGETPPEPAAPEPAEPEAEQPPKEDGFWGRFTRRPRST